MPHKKYTPNTSRKNRKGIQMNPKELAQQVSLLAGEYWHELTDEEMQKLFDAKVTHRWILENIKQPDWCNYPNALEGAMGCWSLTDVKDLRKKISHEFCEDCDCYRKQTNIRELAYQSYTVAPTIHFQDKEAYMRGFVDGYEKAIQVLNHSKIKKNSVANQSVTHRKKLN